MQYVGQAIYFTIGSWPRADNQLYLTKLEIAGQMIQIFADRAPDANPGGISTQLWDQKYSSI